MNTPAHALLGLVLLTGGARRVRARAVLWGALLPDLPMLVFYLWERGVVGVPERVLWSVTYFEPHWQTFIDLFNSIPLTLFAGALLYRWGRLGGVAACAGMLVHQLTDLPLHREDAHRHFFPFSDFRFESPVSYWDPLHHGALAALGETALVLVASAVLWRRFPGAAPRSALAGIGAVYLAAWVVLYGMGRLPTG